VWGLGCRDLGPRVQDAGIELWGLLFRVMGYGFEVWALGFRAKG
jgi:hypothetical protein